MVITRELYSIDLKRNQPIKTNETRYDTTISNNTLGLLTDEQSKETTFNESLWWTCVLYTAVPAEAIEIRSHFNDYRLLSPEREIKQRNCQKKKHEKWLAHMSTVIKPANLPYNPISSDMKGGWVGGWLENGRCQVVKTVI